MKEMMKQFGGSKSGMKEQMDEALMKTLDLNGDGWLTFEEWHEAISTGTFKETRKSACESHNLRWLCSITLRRFVLFLDRKTDLLIHQLLS
jgi:hypothetical protein